MGSTFTITFPVARPVSIRSYAFSASSNAYTESTSGRILPIEASTHSTAGILDEVRTFLDQLGDRLQVLWYGLHLNHPNTRISPLPYS